MGFFSKKIVACCRCGEKFESRAHRSAFMCEACTAEIKRKSGAVYGYWRYSLMLDMEHEYSEDEMDEIARHRQEIFDKYENRPISFPELEATTGAVYSRGIFSLTRFGDTAVDAEDVFAVGYKHFPTIKSDAHRALLFVLFTNDPYIWAFPLVYRGAPEIFSSLCPNLTYPVQTLDSLKAQLEAELASDGISQPAVRGRLSADFMLHQIEDVSREKGIYARDWVTAATIKP